MPKYTEEQLYEIKEAYVLQPEILEAFNAMVEEVREHEKQQKAIKWGNGDTYIDENGNERLYHHLNRRRTLRSGGVKPNLRKKLVETVMGEDGWATTVKTGARKLFSEGDDDRQKFRESMQVKAKPNNKALGSLKAVDPRDAVAEVQKKAFNAFDALNDDDDD